MVRSSFLLLTLVWTSLLGMTPHMVQAAGKAITPIMEITNQATTPILEDIDQVATPMLEEIDGVVDPIIGA